MLVDSAAYARVLRAMIHNFPTRPTPPQQPAETGNFLLCWGTQARYLVSRHDAVMFFQALLLGLTPRSDAEQQLRMQLENLVTRLQGMD